MSNLNKMYEWAINTCNAPNVGYSQSYRYQQTVNGVTYYDCSSFVWYALKAGGFPVTGSAFTTASQIDSMLALGWKEVDINGEWMPCDVVWRRTGDSGHTEIVHTGGFGKGVTMGAHSSKYTLEKQVSINTSESTASSYKKLLRYGSGGATCNGYSLYVISAICGNFWSESHINPGLWEGLTVGNPGYGLGQWTDNSQTDRRTRLFQWLNENGYARDDGNAQLEYFIYENVWYKNGYGENFNSLQDFLSSDSTNLQLLTYAFLQGWEGIWNGTEVERYQRALKCYNYILKHANDSSITSWVVGNKYLTESEILNNAVLVYRYLSAGGGGGGTYYPYRKKMPIWLMLRPIF